MARFFKKLYSLQKETLDDDFPEDEKDKEGPNLGLKIITTLKHEKGVTIKATGFKHPNGNEVEGTLEPEIKLNKDVTLRGKIQTSNKYEATISLNDKLAVGSTLFATGKCEFGTTSKQSVEVGLDYLNKDYGSVNLKLMSPISFDYKDLEIYGAGTVYNKGFGLSAGVDAQMKPKGNDLSKANGYVQYDNSNLSFALFGKYDAKKRLRKAGLGYYQNVNANLKAGVEFSVDPQEFKNTAIRIGDNYKIDDLSSVKGRFSIYGRDQFRVGLVYKQNLSTHSKLTVSSDLNANLLLNQKSESKGHQYGVTLSFFD